jgi:hypothetical protein
MRSVLVPINREFWNKAGMPISRQLFTQVRLTSPRNTLTANTYSNVRSMVSERDWTRYVKFFVDYFGEPQVDYNRVGRFPVLTAKVTRMTFTI